MFAGECGRKCCPSGQEGPPEGTFQLRSEEERVGGAQARPAKLAFQAETEEKVQGS